MSLLLSVPLYATGHPALQDPSRAVFDSQIIVAIAQNFVGAAFSQAKMLT
jgi:hypothetical protein